jgi:hypothetical protein
MCVQAFEAAWYLNLPAGLSSSLTLAGFLVFPINFVINEAAGKIGKETGIVNDSTQHLAPLAAPIICCGLGSLLSLALWAHMRNNYVWILQKIFL